jgi:hypothetical protein
MYIEDTLYVRSYKFVCTKTTVSDVKFGIGLCTVKLFVFDFDSDRFTVMIPSSVGGIVTLRGSHPVTG